MKYLIVVVNYINNLYHLHDSFECVWVHFFQWVCLFVTAEKRKKVKGHSPLQDEPEEEDDYMDEDMKNSDKTANDRIMSILVDYDSDMKNYAMPKSERSKNR